MGWVMPQSTVPPTAASVTVPLGMILIELVHHRTDDLLEQLDLIEVIPDVLQDEEVAVVDLVTTVENGAGGKELHQLDDAAIGDRNSLGTNLEDEPLVARQKLL